MSSQFNFTEITTDVLLTWIIALLFLAVAIMLQWPVIRKSLNERKIMAAINKFGSEVWHDILLPDGLGGITYIEHLLLRDKSITVLSLKRYRGVIFAGQHIDEWTQVLNNNSYRFPNPLKKLEADAMAINNLVSDVDVQGLVLFTSESEFPKGKPDNVMLFSEMEAELKSSSKIELSPFLQTARKELQQQIEPCSKDFIARMRQGDEQQGHGVLAGIFILAALVWIGWNFI